MTIHEIVLYTILYVVCICIGGLMGDGMLWVMRVLHIRNWTVENFIKEHSGMFVWYFMIVTSVLMFLYIKLK